MDFEASLAAVLDTLSVGAAGGVVLGPVEIRAKGSQRLFLDLTDRGKVNHTRLDSTQSAVAVEVGRAFLSPNGHFGRFVIEGLLLQPEGALYLGPLIHTGIRDTPEIPWTLSFHASLRFRPSSQELNLHLGAGAETRVAGGTSQGLLLGATFGWNQRIRNPSLGPLDESTLLSFGPSATWTTAVGVWRGAVLQRVWIDRDNTTTGGAAFVTEFDPPSLSLSWTLAL